MKKLWLCFLIFNFGFLFAQNEQDPFKKLDEKFDSLSVDLERSHQDYLARQDAAWKAYVARIEAKWNEFEESTKKKWVSYSDDLDGKRRVEFENGYVEIEVIQEANDPSGRQGAEKKLESQLNNLFSANNEAGINVLENQVAFDPGETQIVNANNVAEYFNQQVEPNIQEAGEFISNDGKRRIKYRVQVPFVKNHIVRRAEKYLPTVVNYASQFKLDPRLVLAVIYTESAFNPLARSTADAYGLMQLIPRYGARDAYRFVYNQDRMVSPDYLYNPENNIQLGCAYLHVLHFVEWKTEADLNKRRDLSICSYNWGPHNVRKKVYKRFNGNSISYQELYSMLRRYTPEETSSYLEKVLSRRSYFDVFFEH